MTLANKGKLSILDKPLTKNKAEMSLNCYALLFSEMVQYCQSRSQTVPELQNKLHELGKHVGRRFIDLYFIRERNGRREIKLLNILLFVKTNMWKNLFGREADKLEHSNDDENTYYLMESEPIVNRFISVPKDKGSLNCAVFTAGIVEAVLTNTGFVRYPMNLLIFCVVKTGLGGTIAGIAGSGSKNQPAKVTAHWHKGTTYMMKFDPEVIARDKQLEDR